MSSREGRVWLFLGFLILVLVIVNSQSLQLSYESRAILSTLFEDSARERAGSLANGLAPILDDVESGDRWASSLRSWNDTLAREASERGLVSACLIDWEARLLSGGACAPAAGGAFDRLTSSGRRRLLEEGWAMTEMASVYDENATAFGYLALSSDSGDRSVVLRVEMTGASLTEANRRFRTTLIYQVSALSLVLLAVVLFVHSLVAPHRRLVAEARSVASELSDSIEQDTDEGKFLLSTFQEVVARLKDKERELASLHKLEKARADETEALASDIIRSMTTGLVSLDASGRIALVNPAAERIFHARASELRGRLFSEAFRGSDELSSLVDDALERSVSRLRGSTDYRRDDGAPLHLGVSVIPMTTTGEDASRGALCLFADLTEVVQLRERLLLKENLARLGEMAAGIAHEFRNGLATILGNARLLREQARDESADIADALIDESQALSRVVSEFLQFARPEPLELEEVDLSRLAREVASDLRERAASENITIDVEAGEVVVPGDEALLRKALQNLVSNSMDALSECDRADKRVHISVEASDDAATVRVRDNGPGVPQEHRERIFTPFYTGKASGTGLGLSVVQKIAVSHDGSIELEDSHDGVGASFVIRLPMVFDRQPAARDWV
jgi:PAS domain S-box-containing protein